MQFSGNTVTNSQVATRFFEQKLKPYIKTKETIPPFLFIGYGQSGSGKTSTLVNLKISEDNEEAGILIEVIRKLQPQNLEVAMIEIYHEIVQKM